MKWNEYSIKWQNPTKFSLIDLFFDMNFVESFFINLLFVKNVEHLIFIKAQSIQQFQFRSLWYSLNLLEGTNILNSQFLKCVKRKHIFHLYLWNGNEYSNIKLVAFSARNQPYIIIWTLTFQCSFYPMLQYPI